MAGLSGFRAPKTVQSGDVWPPDYVSVFGWRQAQVLKFKKNPELLTGALEFYRTRPVQFINHWAMTYDPRNADSGVPTKIPMILFQRQEEFITFLQMVLKSQDSALIEKCRDMGATWLCCAFSVWMWRFQTGSSVGWGSRKEQLVDKLGDLDSIFEKIRMLILNLPKFFWPKGFSPNEHMAYMRVINPETGSSITGEAGDNIGRGGRKSIYFKDESAHYEHPEKIEAALADNTRVQIDISSVNGTGNVFHRRRENGVDWEAGKPIAKGRTNVFVMDWRDHPAKSQEWYETRRKKAIEDGLLHVFAQEVDRDYAAAVEGVVIPSEWVKAAIDADKILGFAKSGGRVAALDVADGGGDANALAIRQGVFLESAEEWGERDVGVTTRRAVDACKTLGSLDLQYDCIGVGAGVKAEANRLLDEGLMPKSLRLVPWNAGGAVLNPDEHVVDNKMRRGKKYDDKDSPLNKDFYQNIKAQAWWMVRRRFELTWRAVRSKANDATPEERDFTWEIDDLIVIPSTLPNLRKVEKELSQPTYGQSGSLKLMIKKTPDGTRSPNIADAIVMAFWPAEQRKPMKISAEALRQAHRYRPRNLRAYA